MKYELYLNNDNTLEVAGLQNAVTGQYINDATVEVTLRDADGDEVAGQNWPLTLSYVTDSDGIYRGTLEDDLELTARADYTAEITVDAGADLTGQWSMPIIAITREA